MVKKQMEKKSDKKASCCAHEKNPFVEIPCKVLGIFLVLALIIVLFGADEWVLVPVAIAFLVLGFFALLYAYRSEYNKHMKK